MDSSASSSASPSPVGDLQEEPIRVGAGIDFADPNSPLAPLYLRSSQVFAVAVVMFVAVISTFFALWHTDVWGHIKFGEWITEHGRIPDREPFSPWWGGSWPFTEFYTLTHLALSYTYHLGARLAGGNDLSQLQGGVEALRGLHGLLNGLRYAVLLAAFVRIGRSWPPAILALIAVISLDLSNLAVLRPQGFGQLFFAALLFALSREPLSRRSVILVPILFAVWASSHGSYLAGLGVIVLLMLGECFDGLIRAGGNRLLPWRNRSVVRLALVLGLSIFAIGFANPYGFDYFRRTLEMTRHPSLIAGVSEWQPLGFEWAMGWHWVLIASLGISAATLYATGRPLGMGKLLVLLAVGVGAATQNRMVIWWAMVVPWILLPHWVILWDRLALRMHWEPSIPSLKKTLFAVAIFFASLMWTPQATWLIHGTPAELSVSMSAGAPWQLALQIEQPNNPEAEAYPELAAILKQNYPDGRFCGSIMASPMQGDYLVWALAPQVPVTYAHIHLFPPEFWNDIGDISKGAPGWWDLLDQYGANLIVLEADFSPKLREELKKSSTWKIVLDEADDPAKAQVLNRRFIAVRIHPLPETIQP